MLKISAFLFNTSVDSHESSTTFSCCNFISRQWWSNLIRFVNENVFIVKIIVYCNTASVRTMLWYCYIIFNFTLILLGRVFFSRIVHPCHIVPICPLLHFPHPRFWPCRFVHSRKFHQPLVSIAARWHWSLRSQCKFVSWFYFACLSFSLSILGF